MTLFQPRVLHFGERLRPLGQGQRVAFVLQYDADGFLMLLEDEVRRVHVSMNYTLPDYLKFCEYNEVAPQHNSPND